MISNLHIKNIGIIDEIDIDFKEGFNVLTGETGAGKTLIIDSLQILAGGRFSKEMIRTGETLAYVEASINLDNSTDDIIVSREINKNGKNLCKINGRMATCAELKEYMKKIIYIHGQNDNLTILDESTHISILDLYSKNTILQALNQYHELYNKYEELNQKLKHNYGDNKERQRMLDILNYEVNEINEADLKPNEDEEIRNQINIISASEKIVSSLNSAEEQISNNIIDSLSLAIKDIEKIVSYKTEYESILQVLKNSYYDLQENLRDISSEISCVEFNEEELNKMMEREDLINKLKRKYGNSIDEILQYAAEKEDEINRINNLEEENNHLTQGIEELKNKMLKVANTLTQIRKEQAIVLSSLINKELKDLEMNNAKFMVNIEPLDNFSKNGLDNVEFLIVTNVGDTAKPLNKIASGGEMSRIMLAIKTVLADMDDIPIMVFDEIDTGISGSAANSVGEKMKLISNKHQVICVTHQASIAAKGDYNYFISKDVKNNKTTSKIKLLKEKETIAEIARIASGSLSEAALNHAKELRTRKLQLVV